MHKSVSVSVVFPIYKVYASLVRSCERLTPSAGEPQRPHILTLYNRRRRKLFHQLYIKLYVDLIKSNCLSFSVGFQAKLASFKEN